MHAAELLYRIHEADLFATLALVGGESARHCLIAAIRRDWPEAFGRHSGELATRIEGDRPVKGGLQHASSDRPP
jgi:hypothetical protein